MAPGFAAYRTFLMACAAAFAASCGQKASPDTVAPETKQQSAAPTATGAPITPVATEAPAGDYRLDKSHASLVFKVNHIGYSNYTGAFDSLAASLAFDPAAPEKMRVTATIDVGSLDIPAPPEGFLEELKSAAWLNAIDFPAMTFRSTAVTLTGPNSARIDGELDFRGVTAPVALDAVFNGGYAGFPPYDPNARIGFSTTGALKRSVFGVLAGIPTPEAPVGVGDEVTFEIEAEFTGPPTQAGAKPQ
ncbi:MAG: YceI family protein [Parvularculaceae bacterium]